MKKQILLTVTLVSLSLTCFAQNLTAGSDVFLTIKGKCEEQPAVISRLEQIFNEKIVTPADETAYQNSLKENITEQELFELQASSKCIAAAAGAETVAPMPTPMFDDANPLPIPTHPQGFFGSQKSSFFNDPLYRKQDFFIRINAESAYRVLQADTGFLRTPVKIGIIDEGTANDQHPDLAGQVLAGSDVGRSNIKHGQYVLGIMAAKANNSTGIVGVAGINTQFMFHSLRYSNGKVNSADIANTIREFGRAGADAVNLSIAIHRDCARRVEGVTDCYHPIVADPNIRRAIQETARTYGTIFVVSASNESQSVPAYVTPDDGVIVVGSSTSSGKFTDYSNFGPGVDLYVPETGIYGLTKDGYSSSLTGTSFAAPVVTATAALTRHYFLAHGANLAAGEVVRHILRNADSKSELTRNGSSGLQLNLGKVIANAQNIESFHR